MKKLFAALMVLALAAALYLTGRAAGIRHIVDDAVIFTVEVYDPDDPTGNDRPDGTNQTIFIELDGELYERGMYQE